jgi:hypothetical protein
VGEGAKRTRTGTFSVTDLMLTGEMETHHLQQQRDSAAEAERSGLSRTSH